jgi:hypothetical protein
LHVCQVEVQTLPYLPNTICDKFMIVAKWNHLQSSYC